MTTKVEETSWATEAGARVAARRAEREAARKAEAELNEVRERLPVDVLAKRFTETATLVVEAVDLFGAAAGIPIEADGVSSSSIQLKGPAAVDWLWLRRDEAALVVEVRSLSRSEQWSVDLDAEDFVPATTARRIAEEFCRRLAASEGGSHVAH